MVRLSDSVGLLDPRAFAYSEMLTVVIAALFSGTPKFVNDP
jgi:hypothetical protein